jgi:hypothetical protein
MNFSVPAFNIVTSSVTREGSWSHRGEEVSFGYGSFTLAYIVQGIIVMFIIWDIVLYSPMKANQLLE